MSKSPRFPKPKKRPWKTAWRLAKLLLALFLTTGCYYATPSIFLGGINSIGIPLPSNQTSEQSVADSLTEMSRRAFSQEGRLRIADEQGADAILYLDILSVEDRFHPSAQSVDQYRFSVVISVEIKAFEGPVLLKQYEATGWGTYEKDAEREQAIGKAVKMVVGDIIDRSTWTKTVPRRPQVSD